MAVAYRDSTSSATAGATTPLVVPVPAGTVNGDIMIFAVGIGGAAHLPGTPAGLTALDNDTTAPSVQTYWRIASSEPANYSFSFSGGPLGATAIVMCYSGGHQTTPINKHVAWHRSTSTATVTADTVTTDVDGCMLVWLGMINVTALTYTGPTSYTQRQNPNSGVGVLSGLGAELFQASQGATGTVTATASSTGTTVGTLVAIAPAAAAAVLAPPNLPGLHLPAVSRAVL